MLGHVVDAADNGLKPSFLFGMGMSVVVQEGLLTQGEPVAGHLFFRHVGSHTSLDPGEPLCCVDSTNKGSGLG